MKTNNPFYNGTAASWLTSLCGKNLTNAEQFYDCFEEKNYQRSEIIEGTSRQRFGEAVANTDITWSEILFTFDTGICYTTETFGKMEELEMNFINLKLSLPYNVYLHDPNFFLVTLNPSSTPRIKIDIRDLKNVRDLNIQYFTAKKHSLRTTKNVKCVDYDQKGTSFTSCLFKTIVEDTGCKVLSTYYDIIPISC